MIAISFPNATLQIDEQTGTLVDWRLGGRSLLQQGTRQPLFTLQFRDHAGEAFQVSSHETTCCDVERSERDGETHLILRFAQLGGQLIHAIVRMHTKREEGLTFWRLAVKYEGEALLESVRFPGIIVPNDLLATGGDAQLLWPSLEGTLIDDASLRSRTWMVYEPATYPYKCWDGTYPAASTAQMMAYCTPAGGLYVAAHDPHHTPKRIEYLVDSAHSGIQLDVQVFPGCNTPGQWEMPYDMVLGTFAGNWYDAAAIYRRWWETTQQAVSLVLTSDQNMRPHWLEEEFLVVIYPVRGTHDVGDMQPNEYFPYERALPTIERLAQTLDTRILALLMHWEGTAPWAPPSVWPPFGGVESFKHFVAQLHERGHLLGVYGSGIGWTQESLLVEYERREQFEREGLRKVMCLSPSGELPFSLTCAGQQRWGYDICPSTSFVRDVVATEIAQLAETGCDYVQFFDQQIGGGPAICYSSEHGHPPIPGPWQVAAMQQVYTAAMQAAQSRMVLGCESAAAPPYSSFLPMNDSRAHMAFWVGQPVPLHAFLYHQNTDNFMGNQVYIHTVLDCVASPENFLIRLAYAFLAGDRLAVPLGSSGTIQWGWGALWDMTPPDQETATHFLRTLLAWRKGNASAFLTKGRMEKPYGVTGAAYDLIRVDGSRISWPAIMSSRWSLANGQQAQLFVNPRQDAQHMIVHLPPEIIAAAQLITEASAVPRSLADSTDGELTVTLTPLSVVLVTW